MFLNQVLKYFLLFVVFIYLDIYIHELGHAFAGRLMGFSISRITIGTGKELLRTKIGQTVIVITQGLSGGVTYLGHASKGFLKLRYLVFVLGGVLAQGFAVGITMALGRISIDDLLLFPHYNSSYLFIYSNLLLMFNSLIPIQANLGGINYPSDGLQILKIPFFQDKDIQGILAAGQIMEGYEQYEAQHYSQAEAIFRACAQGYPKTPIARINISACLLKQMRWEEALAGLECELPNFKPKDPYVFLVYNNLAWAYLLQFNPGAFVQAQEYSQRALKLNPNSSIVKATRGCILICSGEVEAGIRLLKPAISLRQPIDHKVNLPIRFIALASGYYQQGQFDLALRYLTKIEQSDYALDPDDQALLDYVISTTKNLGRDT